MCIEAVSYTHLDVYKRQAYDRKIPLIHLGITDPRIAPSEGHLELCLLYTSRCV